LEDFGTIKKVEIGKDLDAENEKYICDVEFQDNEDVRKVQIMNMSGVNVRPRVGQKILVLDLGGGFEIGIATDDMIDADLEDGEIEIYSIDSNGAKSGKVKIKPNGELVLNDGTDYAVKYSKLESEFNKLKDDFNSHVQNYNSHTHVTTATVDAGLVGSIAATTSTSSPSSPDITQTKVDKVRI